MTITSSDPTIASQVEATFSKSRLRILIVGAGIAGSTLAALLRRNGEFPAVIERQGPKDAGGYMLGVLPLGGRVLNGLGLQEAYREQSAPMATYEMYNRHGEKPHSYPLAPIVDAYGDWRGITRLELLNLLREGQESIFYNTTIETIAQADEKTTVTFQDGSNIEVDLVVGSEGVHSPTRKMLWDEKEVETFDTGWGGYVLWSDAQDLSDDTYSELWSNGWGIGVYPVKDRLGLFVGANRKHTADMSPDDFIAEVRAQLPEDSCFIKALDGVEIDEKPFFWPMTDIRTKTEWSKGRVVLLGDACTSFLPTAGIGASAAMDSAAALADELSRADAHLMGYALKLYEKRQRHRVEKTQENSRRLAKMMFVDSKAKAIVRDEAMHFYSLKSLVHDISEIIDGN